MSVKALAFSVWLVLPFGALAHADPLKFEHVFNIGSEGVGEGQFKYPEDFAFSKDGNLLVTDASHAWVQVFDKTSGKFLGRFGGKGDDDHHFDKPEGIAVDVDGNIFVADYSTGYVKKFDASYKWRTTFSEYGSEKGQTIKSEFMDIRDGRLYVPEAGNHRISVFDLSGNFLFDFAKRGNALDRVQVFDRDGKPLMAWGRSGAAAGEFKSPAGLAFDKDDNVYVTEIGNDRIQVFDKNGTFLTMWGRKGSANGEFGNLHGIIVDKTNGHVYVADTASHRVQVFRPARSATSDELTR
jgi:DNA-binding beta-propeller fold protein YncE